MAIRSRYTVGVAITAIGLGGCALTHRAAAPTGHRAVTTGAARPAACGRAQLRLNYRGSVPGAGNDLGTIVVSDQGRPCWLAGPITLTGLNKTGRPVTATITYRKVGRMAKAGGRPASQHGTVLRPGLVASISVWAEYRDDPASPNGMCTAHQLEPATWRLRLASGAALTVPNADPAGFGSLTADHGLLTCRGQLDRPQPIVVATTVF